MEACEAGSMFQGLLPDDINVYVTTVGHSSSALCIATVGFSLSNSILIDGA